MDATSLALGVGLHLFLRRIGNHALLDMILAISIFSPSRVLPLTNSIGSYRNLQVRTGIALVYRCIPAMGPRVRDMFSSNHWRSTSMGLRVSSSKQEIESNCIFLNPPTSTMHLPNGETIDFYNMPHRLLPISLSRSRTGREVPSAFNLRRRRR